MAFLAALPMVASAGGMTVDVVDGRIRARFDQVPLREAVIAIAQATGAEVVGAVDMSPAVTLTLERATPEEAFERVLGPGSFLLVYGAEGRLRRVKVLGGSESFQFAAPQPSLPVPSPARMLPLDLLNVQVTVPPEGRLAQTLGTSPTTLRELSKLALHDPDPQVRDEALEAGMGRIEQDTELQATLDLLLQNTDQRTLADQVRLAAGSDGSDFITRALRYTHRPDTRERLLTLLKTLRAE